MNHTERMAIIKQNRRDYKHGVSIQDLDACAMSGWVPDHISEKVVIGRNSLNIACHDIDYLIGRVEALSITEESK